MHSESSDVKTDVLVIGGGGSGLAAALTAAEHGVKKVMVLEKQGHAGGFSAMAHGLFACESPVQRRQMLDVRADDFFKLHMNWAHWSRVEAPLVRAYLNKSGDTVRWLEENGINFELKTNYTNQIPVWHNPVGLGAQLIKVLKTKCEGRGVMLLLQTSGKKIIRTGAGKVIGVIAVDKEGSEVTVNAKSIIIATGGFGGNRQMLKKYCHNYYDELPIGDMVAHHTGDGLLMAEAAGAQIAGSIPCLLVGRFPDMPMPQSGNLFAVCGEPYIVWVNKRGKRFADESALMGENAALMQPGKLSFTLFDESIRQNIEETGIIGGHAQGEQEWAQRQSLPGFRDEILKRVRETDAVKIADAWDDIAGWIGARPETLKQTIAQYNNSCDHGYDEVMVKDRKYLVPLRKPPFYAVRCTPGFHDTMGGIKVTERMEVRDNNDEIIPGLFTAGVIADGWEPEIYCWISTGSAFGFALNSGRIAGETAAEFLSKNELS